MPYVHIELLEGRTDEQKQGVDARCRGCRRKKCQRIEGKRARDPE